MKAETITSWILYEEQSFAIEEWEMQYTLIIKSEKKWVK